MNIFQVTLNYKYEYNIIEKCKFCLETCTSVKTTIMSIFLYSYSIDEEKKNIIYQGAIVYEI